MMKGTRRICLLMSGFVVSCGTNSGSDDVFSQRVANAFGAATVDAIGDRVADWQIANLDDLSYIRTQPSHDDENRKGWQHGALYVGMMNWAALPGNE